MKTDKIGSSKYFEIHYWLKENSHSMDAAIQNRCEYELLGIIKHIARRLEIDLQVEIEPYGEGGLINWLKLILNQENRNGALTAGIIASMLTVILTAPISKLSDKLIDKLFEDTEVNALQKEKLQEEIRKLKLENDKNDIANNDHIVITKRKSNFYESLSKYDKIEKVSFNISENKMESVLEEKSVEKNEFANFILTTDELNPIESEEAIIEIISPVLKKGNYKWSGIYNGSTISFNMKSKEFKTLIQSGLIEFKNGSSINCQLILRRKIDNEGNEQIVGYDVNRVNNYFENDNPVETPEGKKHRQTKEAKKNQGKLFNDEN